MEVLKMKRIFSCLLAITLMLGGTSMATNAVNENQTGATQPAATQPATNQPAATQPGTAQTVKYAHPLDAQAYFGNDLGAVYNQNATTFKVWAPTASGVAVKLYATGSPDEVGAQDISTTAMVKGPNGVWSVTLPGDKKNCYYTYLVTINGVTTETADVYAKAAGVNGNRSMVVDLPSTNPEGWDKDAHVLYDNPTDAIVWEIHVRDFSKSESSGVSKKNRGKYLAFTETGTTLDNKGEIPTCVNYLKKLGVTHVQLMPVYDYATIDESDPDTEEYNWGYDPKNYNVPEGSYSSDAFDGNVRIREFKQMVKALHDAGIGVIMDVVYNHTYTAEGSVFENTVPGYYFRMNSDGTFSDASACGDETASDHLMYRKYMIDSILYWINEYHIDGFRFDLMGIHDIDTMNAIRNEVDTKVKDGKKIILYGEPWTGGALGTEAKTAVKSNLKLLNERVGAFNDIFRDAVKGHVFNAQETGFVQTGEGRELVQSSIAGNCGSSGTFNQPSQVVSYVSAHDNFTLYDKLVLSTKNDGSFGERDDRIIDMNKMAAAITLCSQGISFMQAGEDFARTKYGDENSFVSPDSINQLDWDCLIRYADLNSYYQGLIEIRKNYKPLREPTMASAEKIAFSDAPHGVIAFTLSNSITLDHEWGYLAAAFNASDEDATVTLRQSGSAALPSSWVILADAYEAGLDKIGELDSSTITIPARSCLILADKQGYERVKKSSDKCKVTIEYKDSDSGEVIKKQVIKGSQGSSYSSAKDSTLDVEYDYVDVEGSPAGKFTTEPQKVTYLYKKFTGEIFTLTVKYLQEGNKQLMMAETELSKPVTMRIRSGEDYTAPIKQIPGMKLDTSVFPINAVGRAVYDMEVNYYYIPSDQTDLVLHYYNSHGFGKVYAYVTASGTDGETILSAELPGSEMKADSELGIGWYSLTISGKGSLTGVTVKFSDTSGPGTDDQVYSVGGEVWIKNGEVIRTGELNIIYIQNGTILGCDTQTGRVGEEYATVGKEFENLRVSGSTTNTTGTFTEAPIYVIYRYEEMQLVEKPMMKVVIALGISSLLTLAAAAALGFAYRRKKRNV